MTNVQFARPVMFVASAVRELIAFGLRHSSFVIPSCLGISGFVILPVALRHSLIIRHIRHDAVDDVRRNRLSFPPARNLPRLDRCSQTLGLRMGWLEFHRPLEGQLCGGGITRQVTRLGQTVQQVGRLQTASFGLCQVARQLARGAPRALQARPCQ